MRLGESDELADKLEYPVISEQRCNSYPALIK